MYHYKTKYAKTKKQNPIKTIVSITLIMLAFLLSASERPLQVTATTNNQPLRQYQPETTEQLISRISKEVGHPELTAYMIELAKCESSLNPDATNINQSKTHYSIDRGLYQINSQYHPEIAPEQAYNPEFATIWAIHRVATGYQYEWACNRLINQ